ncbi:unnamed protein product [Rodentolepis nana]|uniref:Ion_trans domain-containing protein n=1 Tax=Rodentolepis nana TaxID=102285 RepID=A0A0R3T0Z7_RODNA|nr:unnamed protein product [Rodentolepis nana]
MPQGNDGARFQWSPNDPEIISDVLFAIANVLSFARTTYLMPAFEALGPLQISFTRMLTDIVRFMVLYVLVIFAFMVGLHNLYWYYGIQMINDSPNSTVKQPSTEVFEGLRHTLYSLFWAMFTQVSLSKLPIRRPGKRKVFAYFFHNFRRFNEDRVFRFNFSSSFDSNLRVIYCSSSDVNNRPVY